MPRTEYVLEWSPGARVGQAWLNVEALDGSGVFDLLGSGIASGMWGLPVAELGDRGRARKSGSMPDIKSVTTFCMDSALSILTQFGVDAVKDAITRDLGVRRWYEHQRKQGLTSMLMGPFLLTISLFTYMNRSVDAWKTTSHFSHGTCSGRTSCFTSRFLAILALHLSTHVHSAPSSCWTYGFLCCGDEGQRCPGLASLGG